MNIIIRQASIDDAEAAYQLIKELAAYENASEQVTLTLEQFIADGFGNKPTYFLNVAELTHDDGIKEIVGITLFFFAYSTWKGRIVYLEDLVVTQKYRRMGIGQLLLNQLVLFAQQHNAYQLRWHVLDWNEPAIKLYQKMGMELDPEWITCRLTKEQIEQYQPL